MAETANRAILRFVGIEWAESVVRALSPISIMHSSLVFPPRISASILLAFAKLISAIPPPPSPFRLPSFGFPSYFLPPYYGTFRPSFSAFLHSPSAVLPSACLSFHHPLFTFPFPLSPSPFRLPSSVFRLPFLSFRRKFRVNDGGLRGDSSARRPERADSTEEETRMDQILRAALRRFRHAPLDRRHSMLYRLQVWVRP